MQFLANKLSIYLLNESCHSNHSWNIVTIIAILWQLIKGYYTCLGNIHHKNNFLIDRLNTGIEGTQCDIVNWLIICVYPFFLHKKYFFYKVKAWIKLFKLLFFFALYFLKKILERIWVKVFKLFYYKNECLITNSSLLKLFSRNDK